MINHFEEVKREILFIYHMINNFSRSKKGNFVL